MDNTFSKHLDKPNKETNDWFQFVQSEVLEQLRTSHTQLNRWIGEFPSKIKKYKMNKKNLL